MSATLIAAFYLLRSRASKHAFALTLSVLVASLLHAMPAQAEIYRWVDAQGKVHYGDLPSGAAEQLHYDAGNGMQDSADDEPEQTTTVHKKSMTATELAQCLRAKGAKYYTASWCPQCARQKRMFGQGGRALPAVECSLDGDRKQTRACKRADIKSYPTWEFADGQKSSGVKSLVWLARRSGCDRL